MFMNAVVLETAVSTIYSATSYYLLLVQYAVFFRVLPCVIAAPMYYAIFFRVRLLLSTYYDSLVPDPGSRSRFQPRAQHRSARGKCSMKVFIVISGLHAVILPFDPDVYWPTSGYVGRTVNSCNEDGVIRDTCIIPVIISTVAPMDYGGLSSILMFAACETQSCVNVTIVDDLVDEPGDLDVFDVTLERTPGLDSRISLDPVDGQIVIIDNDGISHSMVVLWISGFP